MVVFFFFCHWSFHLMSSAKHTFDGRNIMNYWWPFDLWINWNILQIRLKMNKSNWYIYKYPKLVLPNFSFEVCRVQFEKKTANSFHLFLWLLYEVLQFYMHKSFTSFHDLLVGKLCKLENSFQLKPNEMLAAYTHFEYFRNWKLVSMMWLHHKSQ